MDGAAPVALYVHVPFCVSACPYCDFVVYAGAAARGPRSRVAAFLGALHVELDLRADALDRRFGPPGESGRAALRSVYLGGGTPSLLSPDDIDRLLAHVSERFGIEAGAEITIEANPGPDERGDLRRFAEAGVNRLSIGAQRLDDRELRELGRRHRPADVGETVQQARAAGIDSIGIDLLYDVPGDSADAWSATLDAALALEPDHLSLYALSLDDPDAEDLTGATGDHLPVRAGVRRWRDRSRSRQDDDRAAAAYEAATERLAHRGFRGYEISNWAKPGHESRHNLAYWERQPYEAIGPGAHAFDGVTRRWNAARLDRYVAALAPPGDGATRRLPPGGEVTLGPEAAAAEAIVLALRTDRGVPVAAAAARPLRDSFEWARAGSLLEVTQLDRIVLTTRGRLLSNELFRRLV
jgi:oxygen-independent coproporphyrinogen III oxidase